ncbi:HEAT repeat domain-containing protein [Blastopirellula sp. JC732]|uniref:HEAT repeat domain-containing protein n=1 Tax=Blastopirellula sediminis TaxID=2894196 RepID=A0A9X1MHK6_9BACT|nr:HEAT repeat domain-containing protein [Blastopirellula sediminis]MCC9607959.1 HEAT repeat domain-containing protein [Blastopirellula sediminis]MCC9627248.1 HEAT repeat domain-containing protein [Blastopirellula sediminis]
MRISFPRFLASIAITASLAFAGTAYCAPSTVEQSIAALSSTDEETQISAISQLGVAGNTAAVAPLTKQLMSTSPLIRAHAAHALGAIGHDAAPAVDELVKLVGDADPLVRRQAIDALQAIHPDRQKVIGLFATLLSDSDPAVRLRVMHAISDAGKAAVPGLSAALKNEKAAFWACLILREMGPEASEAAPALTALLSEAPIETQREAILALAAMPEAAEKSIPAISKCLDADHLKLASTFALGRIGKIPPEASERVMANVNSPDPLLGLMSRWALARANPTDEPLQKDVVERLAKGVASENGWIRSASAQALISLHAKPDLVIAELHKTLPGADPAILGDAIQVLASLGPEAIPHLTAALKNPQLRQPVAAILGEMGAKAAPAVPALIGLIDDENPRTANAAILAIGKIGPAAKEAVPRLTKALEEGEGQTPHDAALALGQIGPDAKTAEPALTKAMTSSEDVTLRVLSAWALLKIDGKSAAEKILPELTAAIKAKAPLARKGAAELLGQLGAAAKEAAPGLKGLLQDDDAAVRDAAAQALQSIDGEK